MFIFVFELLTAPANVLSSLVVEGYKKMMLVSLIISGKIPALPKYASNAVTRHLKTHTSEYEALGSYCQVWVHALLLAHHRNVYRDVHSLKNDRPLSIYI